MPIVARHLLGLMLLATVAGPGLAAPEGHGVGMRIVATDPDEGETLAPDGALYLRVAYDSAVPVRVRAKGFIGDAEAGGGRRYNPAPVYPAGTHEALAWISFSDAAAIDEIRLYAYDADWKLIGTASVPVSFAWGVPGKRHAGKAPWSRLSETVRNRSWRNNRRRPRIRMGRRAL